MFTNHKKGVAILIESSREYGRGLLLGIARFSRVHDSWLTTHYPDRSLADGIPDWFRPENFDGVIMRIDNERSLQEICATNLPMVDLRCTFSSRAIRVETDDQQVAQLAADHLLDRGFRTIGYCGYAGAEYSERRLRFLCEYLKTRKEVRLSHYLTKTANKKRTTSVIESSAVVAEEDLVRWLLELPQPAGVIACNDVRANQILRTCRELGLIVPEQLAVLGVDNDEVICDLTYPSLSSVVNDTRQIGYRAAELLDMAIDQQISEPILELISPLGVEARLSTDTNLVDDPMVARALVFIVSRRRKRNAMNTRTPAAGG